MCDVPKVYRGAGIPNYSINYIEMIEDDRNHLDEHLFFQDGAPPYFT